MPELTPGDVFVNHRIEGLAGRGGMGVVYRATDLDLDRIVALKVIAPALADDPDFRARFVAESKAAASIEHPHVIPLYYAGERGGVLFIVMRYVDGPDLRALVRAQGSLDPERAALIVSQIGGALDAAHAHGLVHRDVKPANVLLGEGDHAYLTDFGLTKREASTGGVSRAGGWVGTLGFVAPEQIRGERVDARTDVYALGCVLVHALSGGAPYLRDSDEATLWAHLNAPPPTDRVPPEFAAVVERALSKDPADRYPSAGDLGRAALAAAGRSGATGPERNVARGEAAPEGTPQTLPTARVSMPSHEGETHASPDPTRGAGPGLGETAVTGKVADGGGLRGLARRALVLLAALVVVAGVLAAVLLSGGGADKPASADRTTTAPAPASGVSKVDPQIAIATRPNGITISHGLLWVLSGSDGKIVVANATTGNPVKRIGIGVGGTGVAAGFGSIWSVKALRSTLTRIGAKSLDRTGAATTLSFQGQAFSIATGEGAVWVGLRNKPRDPSQLETVDRIDPGGPGQQAIPITGGMQDMAVGEGAVWVTNSFRDSVVRIDAKDVTSTRVIAVGRKPNGIAVGQHAVWVADGDDDALTRINPHTFQTRKIRLGFAPTRVAVGGGSVWVTSEAANQLIRVDPKRLKVRERIRTGSRPYAIDVTNGHALWLTLLNNSAIQRVRFYP
ncbi:MAG TPA: protein kinase [Solirubrobacteraceae bacterium]|jgi:streptogramin lyase|nr:protein kinase [Solirubrobacteraceae bacterium]